MSFLFQSVFPFLIFIGIYLLFENFVQILKTFILFQKPTVLAIGILSARENFIQRGVARSTWLKESDSIKAWFILGNRSCNIPPEYRLSQYSCKKWNINISGLEENIFSLMEMNSGSCSHHKKSVIYQGYSFKVNHPIVVTKLGLLFSAFLPDSKATVAIMDVQSKDIIVQATILTNSTNSIHGYVYTPIENILFPKGYEGIVLFEGYMQHSVCSTLIWNDGGGAITYKRIYSTPHQLDSKKYTPDIFSAVSMEFFVNDLENLKTIAKEEPKITQKWLLNLEEIQKKIDLEENQHDDLLILDMMDIYRNLPVKMLKFYKWLQLNQKFLYVMKTDDDSVINIESLLKKLQDTSKFCSKSTWLWSNVRKDWPVNYVGKWADHDYKATYYPSFPCGAAYVMSQQTVLWLSKNSDLLYSYQGEDVSLGIWLSAINADLIEDKHFECDSKCNLNSYNRAQLTSDQIQRAWTFFEKCKNLCTCEDVQL